MGLKVKVQYFATVRELVGTREETLELPDRSTVKVLLDELGKRHGERLRAYLYDAKTGNLRPSIQLLVGDTPVSATDGSAVLSDGVVFAIIPPVGGG